MPSSSQCVRQSHHPLGSPVSRRVLSSVASPPRQSSQPAGPFVSRITPRQSSQPAGPFVSRITPSAVQSAGGSFRQSHHPLGSPVSRRVLSSVASPPRQSSQPAGPFVSLNKRYQRGNQQFQKLNRDHFFKNRMFMTSVVNIYLSSRHS